MGWAMENVEERALDKLDTVSLGECPRHESADQYAYGHPIKVFCISRLCTHSLFMHHFGAFLHHIDSFGFLGLAAEV